eukprot:Plantae.Rhodophyta-Rhodochaete_pulchella.ctg5020.p4 GENE.Plantae.Rhodophyta-Rhodochaete_pulchella.ctg5020~~Plantae.Rhodophyta-Rhodochaete_pulchella.ctg5020.p4  ORF type:complete len:113 (+),score=11.13 Plantae.Rhodophyta-Rhodochaete_pulchella.ctg5020:1853-2191(+)
MLKKAVENGLGSSSDAASRNLAYGYELDVFRVQLGADPPPRVEPMKNSVLERAKPIQVKCGSTVLSKGTSSGRMLRSSKGLALSTETQRLRGLQPSFLFLSQARNAIGLLWT